MTVEEYMVSLVRSSYTKYGRSLEQGRNGAAATTLEPREP